MRPRRGASGSASARCASSWRSGSGSGTRRSCRSRTSRATPPSRHTTRWGHLVDEFGPGRRAPVRARARRDRSSRRGRRDCARARRARDGEAVLLGLHPAAPLPAAITAAAVPAALSTRSSPAARPTTTPCSDDEPGRHRLIGMQARQLKIPGLARAFPDLARQAREEHWTFEDNLHDVLAVEMLSCRVRGEAAHPQRRASPRWGRSTSSTSPSPRKSIRRKPPSSRSAIGSRAE